MRSRCARGIVFSVLLTVFLGPSPRVFPADCNGNGIDDLADIQSGRSSDCDGNSVPDECEIVSESLVLRTVFSPIQGKSVAVFDLEGDGDLDLAVAYDLQSSIHILQNQGNLKFQTVRNLSIEKPYDVTAGDLDGDGDEDLVASSPSTNKIWAFFNQGDTSFRSALVTTIGLSPSAVRAADLEMDGDLDLVTANSEESSISLLLNDGKGFFTSQLFFPVQGVFPGVLALGDLDEDRDPEIVYLCASGSWIFWNLGDVNFNIVKDLGLRGNSLLMADLNGDRSPDLATEKVMAMNLGRGRFSPAAPYPSIASPGAAAAADLDRNGALDLAVTSLAEASLAVLWNQGAGSFAAPVKFPFKQGVSGGQDLEAADLDGDGAPELIYGNGGILKFLTIRNSRDCNSNGALDECDLKAGTSADCDGNGIPDECQYDCNSNGIADTCEVLDGTSPDCNGNFIPDSCDLAYGGSEDSDSDDIPDECEEARSMFSFAFGDYPLEVRGWPGEEMTFDVYATLTTRNNTSPDGAQGWAFVLSIDENGTISSATLKGVVVSTIYDADPDQDPSTPPIHLDPYLQDLGAPEVFTKIMQVMDDPLGIGRPFAISAVILRGNEKMVLQPNGTQRIAKLTIQAIVPEESDCIPVTMRFEDHLRGDYHSVVTIGGSSHRLEDLGSSTIFVCPYRFRRGDANSDGNVDISDAVFTLAFLYLGGTAPACAKAADTNDDGRVDISDPVFILMDLFTPGEGTRIPPPGPLRCGGDPSPDVLTCPAQALCS